jgi:hypothetical protein
MGSQNSPPRRVEVLKLPRTATVAHHPMGGLKTPHPVPARRAEVQDTPYAWSATSDAGGGLAPMTTRDRTRPTLRRCLISWLAASHSCFRPSIPVPQSSARAATSTLALPTAAPETEQNESAKGPSATQSNPSCKSALLQLMLLQLRLDFLAKRDEAALYASRLPVTRTRPAGGIGSMSTRHGPQESKHECRP